MKKVLVIISFAFIFLLSVSIVSAGFFDWLNGDVTVREGGNLLPTRIVSGDTEPIPGTDYSVEVTSVKDGFVEASVTNTRTGVSERVSLQEGDNTLNGGVLSVSKIRKGNLFTRAGSTMIYSKKAPIRGDPIVGDPSCGDLVERTTTLTRGVEKTVDGHTILITDGVITIDDFTYPEFPSAGANVPIPVSDWLWEITPNSDGTFNVKTAYIKKCGCKTNQDCLTPGNFGCGDFCNLETRLCQKP